MAKKDCLFLISYVMTFVCFIIFLVAFSNENWMSHDKGFRGLWKKCVKNNLTKDKSLPEYDCRSSAHADGPAFLDLSRGLFCLSLVAFIIAMYGYICAERGKNPDHTCKEQMKARIQEIAYVSGGVLGSIGSLIYGRNYYDYYTKDVGLTNVKFAFAFYLMNVATGLSIIFGLLMSCARETGFRETLRKKTRSLRLEKAPRKPEAERRNNWLQNKKVPTPVNQKKESVVVVEEDKKEVPVKSSRKFARFILPISVIQAARRLQKGQPQDDTSKLVEDKNKLDSTEGNSKYKGIFTVQLQKRTECGPPPGKNVVPAVTIREPQSETSLSTSDTSSESSSDDEVGVKVGGNVMPLAEGSTGKMAAVVEAVHGKADKADGKGQNSAAAGKPERPRVRRSATTLGKGEEPEWTKHTTLKSPQRPPPPRKTLSHGFSTQIEPPSSPVQNTIPESNVNIYTLPTEPGSVRPSSSVNYEEVMVERHGEEHTVPQPVLTKQSTVFKPYT